MLAKKLKGIRFGVGFEFEIRFIYEFLFEVIAKVVSVKRDERMRA